jgi:threonine/homoserine/homoserine lactone efflux protein
VFPVRHLLTFSLAAFALIVVPGPTVLFVVSRALSLGRRAAVTTAVGNEVGEYVQITAVAFGVGAVVQRSLVLFTAIKLAGAAYLIFLGIRAIRNRQALAGVLDAQMLPRTRGRIFREGFMVGVTNPKTVTFFAAILPQFVDRSAGHVPLQLLTYGLVFLLIALVSDCLWGLAAGSARDWFARSPRRLARIGGAGGLVMIGLGARLAFTGRKD